MMYNFKDMDSLWQFLMTQERTRTSCRILQNRENNNYENYSNNRNYKPMEGRIIIDIIKIITRDIIIGNKANVVEITIHIIIIITLTHREIIIGKITTTVTLVDTGVKDTVTRIITHTTETAV